MSATTLAPTLPPQALKYAELGIPIELVEANTKACRQPNWENTCTTDTAEIIARAKAKPAWTNYALVAKAVPGGFLFLDDDGGIRAIFESQGNKMEPTLKQKSCGGKFHYIYKHSPVSLAFFERTKKAYIGEKNPDGEGELWSLRINNSYVVGAGSIAPPKEGEEPKPYELAYDVTIIEIPDALLSFLVGRWEAGEKKVRAATEAGVPIPQGQRNKTITSRLGKIHHDAGGLSKETLLVVARDINQYCETPLHDSELETIAGSIARYPVQIDEFAERMELKARAEKQAQAIQWVREPAAEQTHEPTVAMPTSALASTRLQDIYSEMFQPNGWTLDFALPALVTAASAIVPRFVIPETQVIQGDDNMVTLYTALIGEPHCGKSQAMEWAAKAMGIWKQDCGKHFLEIKAGSAEQLIDSIDRRKNHFENSVLVLQDEWSHLFAKAAIPNASFPSFMTSSFYKKRQIFPRPRGKEVVLNLALSFFGGIVEDDFDSVFNASTLGGCYDRFLFGYVPRTWKWDYRPYPYALNELPFPVFGEMWNPIPVTLDGSVFEVVKDWNKKNPDLGRIVEICARIATIYASMDGRPVVKGQDLEALHGLAEYQLDTRKQFQPNAGMNPDAQFANAAQRWIDKNAAEWTNITDLKTSIHAYEMKLGPNVAERALYSLARGGRIQLWINTHNFEKNPMPTDYYKGAIPRLGLVRRVLK